MREYTTIRTTQIAVTTIKHSKFIATAIPVADYDEALAAVADIKRRYADATHNCYAFVADEVGMQCKYSDDGEPSGTAGTPILDVLKRQGLSHVLVVVTRYFGGIKLGANGLVGAYSGAAAGVLDAADKVRMVFSAFCRIRLDYALAGKVNAIVARVGGRVLDVDYTHEVTVRAVLPVEEVQTLHDALIEYTKGNVGFVSERTDYWGYE